MGKFHLRSNVYLVFLGLAAAPLPAAPRHPSIAIPSVPIHFEPNRGQYLQDVQLISQGNGFHLSLLRDAVAIRFDGDPGDRQIRMRFAGANPQARWTPEAQTTSVTNYLVGDRAGWVTGVAQFERVRLTNLYPGIDLLFYGSAGQLEYDFIVHPGADPNAIRYRVEGAETRITAAGDLQIVAGAHTLLHRQPRAYQTKDGTQVPVAASFRQRKSEFAFATGPYDRSRDLVIDPVLFSVAVGGVLAFLNDAIADPAGNVYAVGGADSSFSPTTGKPFAGGQLDAIVLKFDSTGKLIWSTYLGGSGFDAAYGVGLDASGRIVVMGQTSSPNFPMAVGVTPLQGMNKGADDAFVTILDTTGNNLHYSTYFGGTGDESIAAGALDPSGNIVVVGSTRSTDLPGTAGTAQPQNNGGFADILIFKLSPDATTLKFATYLGGNDYDYASSLAFDSSGNIYIAGSTLSSNLGFTPGVPGQKYGGNTDAVVAKLSSDGATLGFLTYLGGSDVDNANGIAAAPDGSAVWITGVTRSTVFPLTANALQTTNAGGGDAFLTGLNASGALVASTFLGGPGPDEGDSVFISSTGAPIFAGLLTTHVYDPAGTPTPDDPEAQEFAALAISPDLSQVAAAVVYAPTDYSYFYGTHCREVGSALICATSAENNSGNLIGLAFGVTLPSTAAPAISFNPPAIPPNPNLAFNSTPPGQTSDPQTVEIQNTGTADLNISAARLIPFTAPFSYTTTCVVAGGNVTLHPGDTCSFAVKFSPTDTTQKTAQIFVADNVSPGAQSIQLSGTGSGPVLTITNPPQQFAQFGLAQTANQTFTITNSGTDTLNVTGTQNTGAAKGFGYTTTCNLGANGSFSLAAGSSCTFTVSFFDANFGPASASANFSGAIVLTDSVGTHPVQFNATVSQPLSINPPSLGFNTTAPGSTSDPQDVEVKNVSPYAVIIGGIQNQPTGSGFSYNTTCLSGGIALQPGDTCDLLVKFSPADTTTTSSGTITLVESPNWTQSLAVSGRGFGPGISIAPQSQFLSFTQFGSLPVPGQTITVTNSGTDTLHVTKFQNTGSSSGFGYTTTCSLTSQSGNLGFSLDGGSSCTFTVTFSASGVSPYGGSIVFTDDVPTPLSTQSIQLVGTVMPPSVPIVIQSVEITQAIQQSQTLSDLQASLATNKEPPVPIIAGKPAVMRLYFEPLAKFNTVTVRLSGVASRTKSIVLYRNCDVFSQRTGASGCESMDFYFTPPAGKWEAVLDEIDTNGDVLSTTTLDVTSRSTNSIRLRGVSVCDAPPGGCASASSLLGLSSVLTKIAPTNTVTFDVSGNTLTLDSSKYTNVFPPANGGQSWWGDVVRTIDGYYSAADRKADSTAGRYTTYMGMIREYPCPTGAVCLNGLADSIPSHGAASLATWSGVPAPSQTVAHEASHTMGLKHTNFQNSGYKFPTGCFGFASDSTTDWPFASDYLLSNPASPAFEVGFDVVAKVIKPYKATFEYMGYCNPGWISPLHYKELIATLGGGVVNSASTAEEAHEHEPDPRTTSPSPFWLVSGTLQNGRATFDALFQRTIAGDTEAGTGTYSLVVIGASGQALFTRQFTPTTPPTELPDSTTAAALPAFSETLPIQTGATAIVLKDPTSLELGRITLGGASPTVAITSPSTGFVGSTAQTVSWTVSDPGKTNFFAKVLYSPDNGTTWSEIGTTQNTNSLLVDFSSLPGTSQALIQVIVSDGVNSGTATSPAFTVSKKLPTLVGIDNPVTGSAQAAADPVYLTGYAYDPDDGALSGAALAWSSNLQGALGTGSPLSVTLQPGSHTITLKATDSDGNSISATTTITIGGQGPSVGVSAAPDSQAPNSCANVTVTAQAGADGAPLSSVQVSVDGGANFSSIPAASLPYTFVAPGKGSFDVVARAYDGSGQSSAQDVTFQTQSTCQQFKCQVSQNLGVTIADVQYMMNQALGGMGAADDVNGDGKVNVVDVVIVMNAALGKGCASGG